MKSYFIDRGDRDQFIVSGFSYKQVNNLLHKWRNCIDDFDFLLILAGSRTAEVEGISWAGATPKSRRYTPIADAEMILQGPRGQRKWLLPPLPGGASPAIISHVAAKLIGVKPMIIASGLLHSPSFPYLLLESPSEGPANCLSSGKAMSLNRVERLWNAGIAMGLRLRKPLLLAECVPGGTTTAHAVLAGMGMDVAELISGSVLTPPLALKKKLVHQGLANAGLAKAVSPKCLLSAVGDPFQVIAAGLTIGARQAGQPVLLGGG